MVYITKQTPTARSGDTPLGKITGYLAELLEYLRWEGYAEGIDALFPDWFPLDIVQNTLIAICRSVYASTYQKSYNKGADKGNELNAQILGWLDETKRTANAYVDDAKGKLQTLISDLDSRVQRLEGRMGLPSPTFPSGSPSDIFPRITSEFTFISALIKGEMVRKGMTEKEAEMRAKGEMVGERAEAPKEEPERIPIGGKRR